jgi:membrane protease YdiL (CAAX protease family)
MENESASSMTLWLRILQFPLVRLLLLGGPLFFLMATNGGFMEKFAATPWIAIAVTVAMAALGFAYYAAFVRFIERRPVSEFALPQLPRELGIGMLVGASLYTCCVLVLMVLGVYRIEGLNPISFMIPAIAMSLSSGVFEELVFRGALFRIVEEWLGSWIALVLSSFVFGFVHLLNPAATLTGALFISIEAGLLLAAAYMVTRRLWMSMAFHMSWNYTQSAVFSGIVSGGVSEPGLVKPIIQGPDFLTGGNFGLEASLVAFVFCTGAGIVLLIMAVRRGNIMPPFWKRAA